MLDLCTTYNKVYINIWTVTVCRTTINKMTQISFCTNNNIVLWQWALVSEVTQPTTSHNRGHTAYHLSQQRSHSLPPLTTEVTQPTSHNRGHTAYHLSQQRSQRSHSLPLSTEVTQPTSHNRGHTAYHLSQQRSQSLPLTTEVTQPTTSHNRGHTAYLSQQRSQRSHSLPLTTESSA